MKNIIVTICLLCSIVACSNKSRQTETLGVLSYNIRNCKGMDNQTDYARVASIITNLAPDVVALQELDSVTQRSNGISVLDTLAKMTNMFSTYSASIDYQGGKYGIGVLSVKPPLSFRKIALPGKEEQRSLLIVEFDTYIFACTHLSLTAEDRLTSVSIIDSVMKDCAKPLLLAGDLNDIPSSSPLQALTKNWTILNNVSELTIPTVNPNRCIDYVLGYHKTSFTVQYAKVLNEQVASDHLPVFVKITF